MERAEHALDQFLLDGKNIRDPRRARVLTVSIGRPKQSVFLPCPSPPRTHPLFSPPEQQQNLPEESERYQEDEESAAINHHLIKLPGPAIIAEIRSTNSRALSRDWIASTWGIGRSGS